MEETPEKTWENLKTKLYPKGVPENINLLMAAAFENSESESEKWEHLANFMKLVKEKFS